MTENKTEVKKIRWNIAIAMNSVFLTLEDSRGTPKATKQYTTAMKRLKSLYNLTDTQVWILCYACERQLEDQDSTSLGNIACHLVLPVMQVLHWNKDIKHLITQGFLQWVRSNMFFRPTPKLIESLYENKGFVSGAVKGIDETEFLNLFSRCYERLHDDERSTVTSVDELYDLERDNSSLGMIVRVMRKVDDARSRFLLYIAACNVLQGVDTCLGPLVFNLYGGDSRYYVATQMMEQSHLLFREGLLEFTRVGSLTEARFTLSSEGMKLMLGENAFLFEGSINDKDFMKNEDIKPKTLFYSPDNQHEIDRLKNALQEDNLKRIQKRLEDDGLPAGIAILLHGAPGTGKTETVYQLAKESGRSIVHVDISEGKSAWFGESEKRIKKIFTSYRNICEICLKRGERIPILLLNEADALISKRKNDTSGNCAQTENTIQNIILEELENLKGIFVATTNLAGNLDKAFERRFLFKIRFENPSREAKTSIWMNKLSWLDQSAAEELSQFDFSGGQIDNIVRKVAMEEVITGDRPDLNEVRSMCRLERLDIKPVSCNIGFGA